METVECPIGHIRIHDGFLCPYCENALLRYELDQIRKDLKGHPDSVLTGENGLAQATMRGFEKMREKLEQVKTQSAQWEATALERYVELEKAAITIEAANDAINFERNRAEKAEACKQTCKSGHTYWASSHEYPCPWCRADLNERALELACTKISIDTAYELVEPEGSLPDYFRKKAQESI